MPRQRYLIWLLIPLCVSYTLLGVNLGLSIYDEGISVFGADRILGGEIPYRDFWTQYAPGYFYLLAAFFKVVGPSIVAERLLSCTMNGLVAFLAYHLAKRIATQSFAIGAGVLTLIWVAGYGFYASAAVTALAWSLLSILLLLVYLEKKAPGYLFLSGSTLGLTGLFRHDFGAYTAVTELLVLGLYVAQTHVGGLRQLLTRALRIGLVYLFGTAIVLVPPSIYLVFMVGLEELKKDLLVFPLTVFPRVRSLPYPLPFPNPARILTGDMSLLSYVKTTVSRIPFYFPWFVYGLTALSALRDLRSRNHLNELKWWTIRALGLLGLAYFNYARVRSDIWHLLPMLVVAVVLFFGLLESWKRSSRHRFVLLAGASLLTLTLAIMPLYFKVKTVAKLVSGETIELELVRGQGIHVEPELGANYQEAIRYVQSLTDPYEPIFVGNTRHDLIFVNDVMFYFLAERRSATKFHELHPGLATTLAVQGDIIGDLERRGVRIVVLREEKLTFREPNESFVSTGVNLLDKYIRQHFKEVERFGNYVVMTRKEQE